jgi:hypothetical protein
LWNLARFRFEARAYAGVRLTASTPAFPIGQALAGGVPLLAAEVSLRYGLRFSADATFEFLWFRAGASFVFPVLDEQLAAIGLPSIAVAVRGFGCLADGRRYVHFKQTSRVGAGNNGLAPSTDIEWALSTPAGTAIGGAAEGGLELVAGGSAGADVIIYPPNVTSGLLSQVAGAGREYIYIYIYIYICVCVGGGLDTPAPPQCFAVRLE